MKTIIRNREQGAVAPLVAILMVAFMLCVAIVVDLGHLHNVKVELQRAVDAAALAGAQQLDGGEDQEDNAEAVANAVLAINKVDGAIDWTNDADEPVQFGAWLPIDPDEPKPALDLDNPDNDRFDENGPTNAILVTAKVEVNYYFYLFGSGSTVSADAIAVSKYEEKTIPIAVTSCIPAGGEQFPHVSAPGEHIEDLALYTFGDATQDTAGWSSLTITPSSTSNTLNFFREDGTCLFNKVVFGKDEGHDGLENMNVWPMSEHPEGCSLEDNEVTVTNFEDDLCNTTTVIKCGLGDDFSDTTTYDPAVHDPLEHFGNLGTRGSLPRWNDVAVFKAIWSMNGVLRQSDVETDTQYSDRLTVLLAASEKTDPTEMETAFSDYNLACVDPDNTACVAPDKTVPGPSQDARFTRYIKSGKADFLQPLREAGYPIVDVTNGAVNTVLKALLEEIVPLDNKGKLDGPEFKQSARYRNFPFDAAGYYDGGSGGLGQTVQVTVPVIFVGECEDAKFVDAPYIGTANLLFTRIWLGINNCYDNGPDSVKIDTDRVGEEPMRFGPDKQHNDFPALNGEYRLRCSSQGFYSTSFEGVLRPPAGDEETKAGIQKIYLVK
ncbi:MAG: pilus assembly protein TadG-related protein [Desulfobulbaceae bacterium]|jgi:Flp pilus assembly protein TadG|nr:pilus assembly protein TadG-related protein [Desulfobulbaceae bacterium]